MLIELILGLYVFLVVVSAVTLDWWNVAVLLGAGAVVWVVYPLGEAK